MKKTPLLIILCTFLLSCLDEYKVPINQKTEQLVVEALLTDEPILPQLKLSLTEQFGNTNSYKPVRGAFVQVIDNEGKTTIFQANPNLQGIYNPSDLNFRASIGKTYKLTIKLTDGRTFESPNELMPKPVVINQLSAIFQNPAAENRVGRIGYQIYAEFDDPKGSENYYRSTSWGIYKRKSTGITCNFGSICNDQCWVREENSSPNLFSDAGLDGSSIRKRPVFFSPFYFYGKHYIEVKQYSITRNTYQFWRRFNEQNNRTGSIFDPIPAPVTGNMVNKDDPTDIALGYFELASVSKKRLEIPGDTLVGKVQINQAFVGNGDCQLIYPFSVLDRFPPPGW